MIKSTSNKNTVVEENPQYKASNKTSYQLTVYSFKKHGKFNTEELLDLDEKCISNGTLMIHNIVEKLCTEKPKRECYYMTCAPKELSGCPHLIIPTYL